jgi:DNA-binding MurR/RpiR family transcriptional regulator
MSIFESSSVREEGPSERIGRTYGQLSASHRRAADFVLKRPLDAATMTIDGLAEASGISLATANRFVRALGYDGYGTFRAALIDALKANLDPVQKLEAGRRAPSSATDVMRAALTEDTDNLQRTAAGLSDRVADQAVDLLLNANRIYTLGFGVSTYIASHLANGLDPFCPGGVRAASAEGGTEQAARRLLQASDGDVLVAISLPRYSRDTVELAGLSRERGVALLALTDTPRSPLVGASTLALYAGAHRTLMANSAVATFALAEALISAVVHRREGAAGVALRLTEQVLPYLIAPDPE